jgi:Domain of unknown function (DUF6930)
MKEMEPTLDDWRDLYHEAVEFRKIEPWKWTAETDLFGVRNPAGGEIGYCCILGEIGEVLGIVLYLGSRGLEVYKKIQKGHVKPGDPESIFLQDCIIASFEEKRVLEKEDKAIVNALGLKFRGSRPWPLFRRYKPGYFPWFLERDEVLYLTVALQQAKDVCLRFRDDRRLLWPPRKNRYLVRAREIEGGAFLWKDVWMEPAPIQRTTFSIEPVDEVLLRRVKNKARPSAAVWEMDLFYTPAPVAGEGEERPFFPRTMMTVDHDSGLILDAYLAKAEEAGGAFQKRLLSLIENTLALPLEILVTKEEAEQLLEPYTSRLHVKLSTVRKLPMADKARRELIKSLPGL